MEESLSNPSPTIVTVVPPAVLPNDGVIDLTIGVNDFLYVIMLSVIYDYPFDDKTIGHLTSSWFLGFYSHTE